MIDIQEYKKVKIYISANRISKTEFLLFPYNLPLKKGVALHFNEHKSPLLKNALCQVWLKLAQWFLRRRWKGFRQQRRRRRRQQRQRRRTTDRFWFKKKLTWAFGSGKLKSHKLKRKIQFLAIWTYLDASLYKSDFVARPMLKLPIVVAWKIGFVI